VVSREKDINLRRFRAGQVQRIVCSVTGDPQFRGTASDGVVHCEAQGCECQQGAILQPPFNIGISIDLISQCLAWKSISDDLGSTVNDALIAQVSAVLGR